MRRHTVYLSEEYLTGPRGLGHIFAGIFGVLDGFDPVSDLRRL